MTALWTSALERLAEQMTPQNFEMWLRPVECVRIEDGTIHLRAPNPYVKWWFENNYLDAVLNQLRTASQGDYSVEIDVSEDVPPARPAPPPAPAPRPQVFQASAEHRQVAYGSPGHVDPHETDRQMRTPSMARGSARYEAVGGGATHSYATTPQREPERHAPERLPLGPPAASLNPRYTFDTFVAGPSNQLAYAASQAAATTYPPKYNPIFVCGGVGLGKTHLLHAVGHEIHKSRPSARIAYISGERFMNEYIQAIRSNKMPEFRSRYRDGCDVLLVDDVQFLAGKDGTQDEFFHTFNALHDNRKQIVLTADRKPHEISDIADRLRTRFAWGLMADIEPPELEVRVAILRKKAAAEQIHLPDDVALYIATAIKSNVRELEGALIRLAAYASLEQQAITIEFARQTLEGSLTRPPEHITVDAVLKAVANYYGLKISDLKSPRRHKSIAGPRAVAMYLARRHTKQSYPDLGRAFGGKHHTTVISAVEKVTKKLETDPTIRGEVHAIEGIILR